jgi:hypothetical protein
MESVPGSLLTAHTDPPGLEGLFSFFEKVKPSNSSTAVNVSKGWDRVIVVGNCMIYNLDVVLQPLAQRFLELVLASTYHYRHRWNEQATLGMLFQLFLPDEKLKTVPIAAEGYEHGKRNWTSC